MRAHIGRWTPGVYKATSWYDHDGVETERFPVPVTITVKEDEVEIDLREVDQDDTHWLQHRVGFPVGLRCPVVLRGVVDWSGVSGAALRTRASAVATVLSRAALPHRPPSWHVSGRGSG